MARRSTRLRLASCEVDLDERVADFGDGRLVRLTSLEARLLGYLAARPGEAVPREVLLREVWGYSPNVVSRAVDTAMKRLRRKLERNPGRPDHLLLEHGVGYCFRLKGEPTVRPGSRGFVGRSAEVVALRRLVELHARVAVVGPAGVGKSRLVAEALADRGAVLVDLSGAETPDDLDLALAAAGRGDLLVLDDVDRVVPFLTDRSDAVRGCRVVLTSRERPGLPDEVVRVGALAPSDAERLFLGHLDRLGVVGWATDTPELPEIASQLDHLPLALEYAAAHALLLSPKELLAAVRAGPGGMGGGRGTHVLAQSIAWTWSQLERWEQTALSQLSAFDGGFTLAAAGAVLDLTGLPGAPGRPLDVLQRLVDKSLVCALRRPPEVPPRFSVYNVLREFTGDRLTLHPHRAGAIVRHADWALAEADRLLAEPDAARLAVEAANLRTAWAWMTTASPSEAVRIARALRPLLAAATPGTWDHIMADAARAGLDGELYD